MGNTLYLKEIIYNNLPNYVINKDGKIILNLESMSKEQYMLFTKILSIDFGWDYSDYRHTTLLFIHDSDTIYATLYNTLSDTTTGKTVPILSSYPKTKAPYILHRDDTKRLIDKMEFIDN